MKISSLMIHDWYYDVSLCEDKDNPNDKYREARQVGSIEHFQYDAGSEAIFRVNANLYYPQNWLPTQEKNIRPIPLSDKFFKENGFEEYEVDENIISYFRQKDDEYGLPIYDIEITHIKDHPSKWHIKIEKISFLEKTIYSVDEFQRCLRMCDLQEIANNLKVK